MFNTQTLRFNRSIFDVDDSACSELSAANIPGNIV